MRILLVDDVPAYLELLREPLAEHGYDPVVATCAAEARLALARHRPRLVFLDARMPGEDGDRLCREIKVGRFGPPVPVVMTGAGGRDDERRRCELAGCDAFLTKPVRPAVTLATAGRFLRVPARTPRVPLRVPVRYEGGGERRLAEGVNVSSGGLLVVTSWPLPPGTEVTVELRLPASPDEAPLRVRGSVCWSDGVPGLAADAPAPMAVRFEPLTPETQAAVERFVRRGLASGRAAPSRLPGGGDGR